MQLEKKHVGNWVDFLYLCFIAFYSVLVITFVLVHSFKTNSLIVQHMVHLPLTGAKLLELKGEIIFGQH